MKLALVRDVSSRFSEASGRYQVPQRLRAAGETARHGAHAAYRMAFDHPKTSIASAIVAAALVGGLLYYMFGDLRRPVERRRKSPRVRAVSERRKRHARAQA